jgi:hypothetical protein
MPKYVTDQPQGEIPPTKELRPKLQEPVDIKPLHQSPGSWEDGFDKGEIALKSMTLGDFTFKAVTDKGAFQGAYRLKYPDDRDRVVVLRSKTEGDVSTSVSAYDVDLHTKSEQDNRLARFYRVNVVEDISQMYLEDNGDVIGRVGMAAEAARIIEEDAKSRGTGRMRVLAKEQYVAPLQSAGYALVEEAEPTKKGKRLMYKSLSDTQGIDAGTHHNFRTRLAFETESRVVREISGK